MSQELIWSIIKDNHAFKITRGGVTFSSEAGNLRNKHSLKYSGLARRKTIDIQATATGAITVASKLTKKASFPAQSMRSVGIQSASYRRSAKVIRSLATSYAPELRAAALGRFHRIKKVQRNARLIKANATKVAAK
eukprot:gene16776-19949_t